MTTIASTAVHLYRRFISPYKGFRCAHQAVHGRGSCSNYGLRVYDRRPFGQATALLKRRLEACRAAYQRVVAMTTAASASGKQDAEEHKKHKRSACDPGDCGASDCAVGACDLSC